MVKMKFCTKALWLFSHSCAYWLAYMLEDNYLLDDSFGRVFCMKDFLYEMYFVRKVFALRDIFMFHFEQAAIMTDILGGEVLLHEYIALENRVNGQMRCLPGMRSAVLCRMHFW